MGEQGRHSREPADPGRVFRIRMYDGDRDVPYRLCRSARARAIRISIDRDCGITLTLPPRTPERDGLAFLASKAAWLRRHLSRRREPPTLRDYLTRNPAVTIDGVRVPLAIRRDAAKPVLRYSPGAASVTVETGPGEPGDADLAPVLRGLAARVLPSRTMELARRHGFEVKRVSVRDQSSRWGSCSSARSISLNWRLLLVPPEIQDYVILHELAHLRHMNHSPRYWRELCRLDPDARERDRWLNGAGEEVMGLARMAIR